MKRASDSRTADKKGKENLPSFLDETSVGTDAQETHDAETAVAEAAADDAAAGEPVEASVVEDSAAEIDTAQDADDTDAEAEAENDERAESSAQGTTAPAPEEAHAAPAPRSAAGGAFLMVVGALLTAGGIALGVMPATNAAWTRFMTPPNLLVLGGVAFAAGATQRRIGAMQQGLRDAAGAHEHRVEALQTTLQRLAATHDATSERLPEGEELQHLALALQRQDEKINNLTKAIKMYGKPLMEIAGQGTELAGTTAQVKTSVDANGEALRQAFARLETQLRSREAPKLDTSELQKAIAAMAQKLEGQDGKAGKSLEPLQQQVARIEVSVAAISQRLEDSEMKKSILRLEDATQKAREEVAVLARGESVQKATAQLQDRFDKATSRLSEGIVQMREGNLSGLENAVREIQREIAGVATAVAQIQATVKSGGLRAAPAAPAAPAAGQAAPAERPAVPAAATAQPAAPASAPAADKAAPTGYQTGTRSSGGKNVLGAIAKLKQMKS